MSITKNFTIYKDLTYLLTVVADGYYEYQEIISKSEDNPTHEVTLTPYTDNGIVLSTWGDYTYLDCNNFITPFIYTRLDKELSETEYTLNTTTPQNYKLSWCYNNFCPTKTTIKIDQQTGKVTNIHTSSYNYGSIQLVDPNTKGYKRSDSFTYQLGFTTPSSFTNYQMLLSIRNFLEVGVNSSGQFVYAATVTSPTEYTAITDYSMSTNTDYIVKLLYADTDTDGTKNLTITLYSKTDTSTALLTSTVSITGVDATTYNLFAIGARGIDTDFTYLNSNYSWQGSINLADCTFYDSSNVEIWNPKTTNTQLTMSGSNYTVQYYNSSYGQNFRPYVQLNETVGNLKSNSYMYGVWAKLPSSIDENFDIEDLRVNIKFTTPASFTKVETLFQWEGVFAIEYNSSGQIQLYDYTNQKTRTDKLDQSSETTTVGDPQYQLKVNTTYTIVGERQYSRTRYWIWDEGEKYKLVDDENDSNYTNLHQDMIGFGGYANSSLTSRFFMGYFDYSDCYLMSKGTKIWTPFTDSEITKTMTATCIDSKYPYDSTTGGTYNILMLKYAIPNSYEEYSVGRTYKYYILLTKDTNYSYNPVTPGTKVTTISTIYKLGTITLPAGLNI